MARHDGRAYDQLRPVSIETGYVKYPHGSALISFGDTRVLCTVQVDEKVPPYVAAREVPQGWITAEYALMPAAGLVRNDRAGYGKTTDLLVSYSDCCLVVVLVVRYVIRDLSHRQVDRRGRTKKADRYRVEGLLAWRAATPSAS